MIKTIYLIKGWLNKVDPVINLNSRLQFNSLQTGRRFRFRLRANPSVRRNGKRVGLFRLQEQESWIVRKGQQHGFSLSHLAHFDFSESTDKRIDVQISHEQMLWGKQNSGNSIHIYSVLYDGVLSVTESERFKEAVQTGIGHCKALG